MARRAGLALIANLLILAAAPCGAVNSAAYPSDLPAFPDGSGANALQLGAVSDANAFRVSRTAASGDDCGDCGGGGGGGQGDTGPERGGPGRSGAFELWALGVLAVFVTSTARGRLTRALRRRS